MSALGRPKGKEEKYSLKHIVSKVSEVLNVPVLFASDCRGEVAQNAANSLQPGQVLLLENLRFYAEEEAGDVAFAKELASLGDIYINDAFSCSHREEASIHKITKYIKESYAGPLLKKELAAINTIIENKKEPVTCIIGGSKISTKINVITNLIKNVNNIIMYRCFKNEIQFFL